MIVNIKYVLWTCAHHDNDIALGFQPHVIVLFTFRCVETNIALLVPRNIHEKVKRGRHRIDRDGCPDSLSPFQSGSLVQLLQSQDQIFCT